MNPSATGSEPGGPGPEAPAVSGRPVSGRARPLPPDERRAALIAATLPLVSRYGPKVTTRQIAEAAGVAEGTIFRVFPDKESLIKAAVDGALDPQPTLDALAAVRTSLPLRERLTEAVGILRDRLITVLNLVTAIGLHTAVRDHEAHRAAVRPNNEKLAEAFVRLLEPDLDQLRYPPGEIARLIRLLTFSLAHPLINEDEPYSADEIVSILLDGVGRHLPAREQSNTAGGRS